MSPLPLVVARSHRKPLTVGKSTVHRTGMHLRMVLATFGSGKRLILGVIIHPLGCVEHILRDQFHGRRELAGQDCVLFGECADLRGKLVDDLVRVGWNLLSQNVSLNTKPPQSVWIAGVEKNGEKRGQSAAVMVSIRVTAFNSSKVRVRPRFVFTSVKVTDAPESSKVASTPRW